MKYDPNTGEPIINNNQPVQQNKTNGFAIAGFICSIFVGSITGIIFSAIGLAKVKETGNGKGLGIAGIIISIVRIVILVACLTIFFILVAPNVKEVVDGAKCSEAYSCGQPNSAGMVECKYRDENNTELTITCPSNQKTTKEVTTTAAVTTAKAGEVKEYKLSTDNGASLYADVLYLKDNVLYGHLTSLSSSKIKASYTINGQKVASLVTNVSKVWVVEVGQAGWEDVYFTDKAGALYVLNINANNLNYSDKTIFGFNKVNDDKNIKEVYSMPVPDAITYEVVNDKNQAVNIDNNYIAANYDKVHNINETKVGNDIIKLNYVKSEKDAKEKNLSHNYFEVYINGTKMEKLADYQVNTDFDDYNDIKLVQIYLTKSGNTYNY